MRIRRRPLPFPPLLPAPPKPQSTIKPGSLLVQDQEAQQKEGLLLHQDGDLHAPDPPRSGRRTGSGSKGVVRVLHPFPARKFEVPGEEEEEKSVVVVECKRIAAPTPSIDDSNALNKEEKGKDKIKKPKRSQAAEAVILEGSRCSRINGRGWRCAQPTLVGYSLCEHHLGKGRSSRGPSIAPRGPLGCTEHKKKLESGEGSLHEIIAPRRRSKARSISSLLDGQTNGDNQLISDAMKNGEGVVRLFY